MRKILSIARKEFLVWAQRPGSWIVIFIVPLLFIGIMQAVFGSTGSPVITIYVVNEDKTSESKRVINALRDSSNLKIEELKNREEAEKHIGAGDRMAAVIVPQGFSQAIKTTAGGKVEVLTDPARAEQAKLVIGLVNAALGPILVDAEVSRGVEAGVSQVMKLAGGSEALTGQNGAVSGPGGAAGVNTPGAGSPNQRVGTATPGPGSASNEFGTSGETPLPESTPGLTGTRAAGVTPPAAGGAAGTGSGDGSISATGTPDPLQKFFSAALKGVVSSQVQESLDNPQVQLDVAPYASEQPVHQPSLLDYLVPGYSLMFVFFLIPNLAMAVIEERQTGTLRRLMISPVSRSQILLGKMLPYFLIGVAQFTFVLLVSKLVFGISLGSSPVSAALSLGIIIVCSSAAMAALGILIAALARTQGQADGLAVIIVLAMAVVSGAMFPNIYIPGVQMLTPHYWALQGFVDVIARGQGIEGVLRPAGVLLTMAAVLFTAGAVRFKFE